MQRTFREIAQMKFFDPENIGLNPIPDPVTNTVDIKYTLVEKSNSQVELQGGWGGNQFIGSVGLSFGNFAIQDVFDASAWRPFPLGNGQTVSLKTQMGYYFEHYSISFSEPWLGGEKPTAFSVSLFHSQRSPYSRIKGGKDTSQKLYITGGGIGITSRLEWPDDYFILSHNINYERYVLDNYSSFYLFDFENGFSNNLNYKITLGRNSSGPSPIYPKQGSEFLLSGKVTLPYSYMFNNVYEDPGEDATEAEKEEYNQNRYKWLEYYKINVKGTWYTEIFKDLILKTNAEAGFLKYYNPKVGLSPFERFYVGGDGINQYGRDGRETIALRGYDNNSLSSSRGGTMYHKFTFELRYPITLSPTTSIYVLSFVEAGASFDDFDNYQPFELKRSTGMGVRIFLPMLGLLGIDIGYGFDNASDKNTISGWQTHFIFGRNI